MRSKNEKKNIYFNAILVFCFLSAYGCRLYNLEKKLSPEFQEFLSKVHYIVTKEERKIFLELPDSEKNDFIREFWSRRDPDPYTEENEFKEEYFRRIDDANRLFHGHRPGWIQDRGRIYILFGPPSERHTYSSEPQPREVWYYGNFPVIFIDHMGVGDYKLETINLAHLSELNKAQSRSQTLSRPEEDFFDFDLKTQINEKNDVIMTVGLDYRKIWFTGVEDRLETTIVLAVEVLDVEKKIILSDTTEYPISIHKEDIGKKDKMIIEYPLKLKKGTYTLNVELENRAGKEKRKKTLKLKKNSLPVLTLSFPF
jgi:GWxTD domain-containing protein